MATRHQVRETIITILYAKDVGNDKIEQYMDEMFENKKIRNKQREFAHSLYNGIKTNLNTIDNEINKYLKEWKLESIGTIERAILRLGTYELMHSELDSAVVINEAIELAKNLASDSSPKFINGVLDTMRKSLD